MTSEPAIEKNYDCVWRKEDFFATANAKESIGVIMFLFFLAYTLLVFLREKNQHNDMGVKLFRLINELALSHVFFFVGVILAHVLTPNVVQVVLILLYTLSLGLEVAATRNDKDLLNKVAFWGQTVILILMYFILLTNDWCRFFLYRGHA